MQKITLLQGFLMSLITVIILSMSGCREEGFDPNAQFDEDLKKIDQEIASKGLTAQIDEASGIRYVVHEQGNGYHGAKGTKVNVHLDEFVFNSHKVLSTKDISANPFPFKLFSNNEIVGLNLAISLMKGGDSTTFYVPSYYCYGYIGSNDVPSNSILTFNIKNYGIQNLSNEITAIDNYIADKQWQANIDEKYGIRYIIHKNEAGESIDINDIVKVEYTGRLLSNNAVFDNNSNFQFTHRYNEMITGWELAMEHLSQGDSVTFFVPSQFGYGDVDKKDNTGKISIPKNSTLMFSVKVLYVNKK